MVGFDFGDPFEELQASSLVAVWAAASAVSAVGFLLATSTTTVSSAPAVSPAAAAGTKPSSVEIAPVTAPSEIIGPTSISAVSSAADQSGVSTVSEAASVVPSPTTEVSSVASSSSAAVQDSESSTVQYHSTPQRQTPSTAAETDITVNPASALLPLLQSLASQEPADTRSLNTAFTPATTTFPTLSPLTTPADVPTDDSQTPNLGVVVASQTVVPGSSITVGSGSSTTVIALYISGSNTVLQVGIHASTELATLMTPFNAAAAGPLPPIVVGSVTASLASVAASVPPTAPIFTVGSDTISADHSSHYMVAGQTLAPGYSVTIGSGSSATVVALQTSGRVTYLVVGSSTALLTTKPQPEIAPPLTLGSSLIKADSESQYIIRSQTLAPGHSITIGSGSSATVVALQTSEGSTYLVVGSSTALLTTTQAQPEIPPPLIIGSSLITADSKSQYIIGSQTLSPGGSAITVSGTIVSLAPGATELVVGTSSEGAVSGIGGYIWSGLGSTSGPTSAGPIATTPLKSGSASGAAASSGLAVQTTSPASRLDTSVWTLAIMACVVATWAHM
ncbi:hypothetical protein LTR36_007202 [Oleoguttula mirabilis]|uniref:Uncharacterized protein n=1 Tax=Oleoguttula mirabilis TaxID=1507867 RepID=A0AAV9JA52_9PEZI|nr:hypothetical protein LTR36_007202 [Oleoguttula mirabilis]